MTPPSADPQRNPRRLALVVAALLLIGLGAGALLFRRPSPEVHPAAGTQPRRSVAVLGFKNLSGRPDAAWLSTALSEMLTTELAAGEQLRLIPGETVAQVKRDLDLHDSETLATETLAAIRKNLGTDLVVLGSYLEAGSAPGSRMRVELRLQDAVAGDTVASLTDTATEAELPDLVFRAAARLREGLSVGQPSSRARGARPALPSNAEATRLYAEGLTRLRVFEALEAQRLLESAVAADPASPMAHSALAAAWSALGYDGKAKQEVRRAFDLSATLSREERLFVEGLHRETEKDWEKAIEIDLTLVRLFPDSVEYGLRLAEVQTAAGKGKDALTTVEALRRLPAAVSLDPRIDLAESAAAESLSDYRVARAAAARAAEKGAAAGARLIVARARFEEARVFWRLGDLKQAAAAAGEARRAFRELGDHAGVARALNLTANLLREKGEIASARRSYEEALAISRQIGDQDLMLRALNNLALTLWDEGRLAKAGTALEETLTIAHQIGSKEAVAVALLNLGDLLRTAGDLRRAQPRLEESLAISREIGDRRREAYALFVMGQVLTAQGELAAARQKHQEALSTRKTLASKASVAESQLALAELGLEDDRAADAEARAREAADVYRERDMRDDEALAQGALARALLARGKTGEARRALERALALCGKSQSLRVRTLVGIAAAQVRLGLGEPAEARTLAEAALAAVADTGFAGLRLDAGLVLGGIEVTAGKTESGRARLRALEEEASAKGFGLIARKARAAS